MKRYKRFEEIQTGATDYEIIHTSGRFINLIEKHTPKFPDNPRSTATNISYYYEMKNGTKIKDNTWGRGGIEPIEEYGRLEAMAAEAHAENIIKGKGVQEAPPAPPSYDPEKDPIKQEMDKKFAEIQKVFDEAAANEEKKLKKIQKTQMLNRIEALKGQIDELEAE